MLVSVILTHHPFSLELGSLFGTHPLTQPNTLTPVSLFRTPPNSYFIQDQCHLLCETSALSSVLCTYASVAALNTY